ncbi:astacin-like metalloendopeptidase [Vulpes lagopus]|uniref:astacin-like metalloendopeptidase n=1 Tax=Vulpes lagopus TaxID=494514 RepID=UPI001BC98E3D|nr:astacin-like metalloendopeptidase [Vulpes lagopus]
MNMGGLWPWVMGLLCLPGLILGAPSVSSSPEACGTSFSEDLNLEEETQTSWDKDIPAINQGLIPEETPESSFLLEGDILRPSPFRLFSTTSNKWPKNGEVVEVPFLLSSKYDKPSREVLLKAFAEFERLTCIRFVAYEGQRDFISIIPMSGCFSSVGRSGGMQVVSLAPTCLQRGPGIVLHELMHVLGFWHEHSRADRDQYIRINWNEIIPGFEINFIKSRSSNMLVPYDYSSVMHYGRLAFSRRGLPTITPLWASNVHIGQRWNLSTSDITRVLKLYDCNPSGQGTHGRGFQPHSDARSPTPASRPYLQQLLKALLAQSGSPDPSGSKARGQRVVAVPGESPRSWELPALREVGGEASAGLLQIPDSSLNSRPGAGVPGISLETSWLAQVPSVPPTTAPEAEDQLMPNKDALGNSALPGARWWKVPTAGMLPYGLGPPGRRDPRGLPGARELQTGGARDPATRASQGCAAPRAPRPAASAREGSTFLRSRAGRGRAGSGATWKTSPGRTAGTPVPVEEDVGGRRLAPFRPAMGLRRLLRRRGAAPPV